MTQDIHEFFKENIDWRINIISPTALTKNELWQVQMSAPFTTDKKIPRIYTTGHTIDEAWKKAYERYIKKDFGV